MKDSLLIFAHIGDLHITKAREQNYIDFLSIVSQIEIECSSLLDFVYLPGDNADNGLPEQYKLVATALKMLSVPTHIISGDHDMEQGSLNNFYENLRLSTLPKSLLVHGYRCVFLDVCGRGNGGPDFRLKDQLSWLETELDAAKINQQQALIFTHTYPVDINDYQEVSEFNKIITEHDVVLVDMGHTHYNEIASNGKTIFSATRSTGQIEEGPVGYSITTVDNGIVSWRFKPLADPFPFVIITSPVDYRLVCSKNQNVSGRLELRAVVFGSKKITKVNYKIDDGNWFPMVLNPENLNQWTAPIEIYFTGLVTLTVEATDETGRPGRHSIQTPNPSYKLPVRVKNGSDEDSIGAWPENGIFGTQLGPNRNGKPS